MATCKTVDRITDTLRDSGLSWLLGNLRQEFVVWKALNEPAFFDKVAQAHLTTPADFSPGRLALLALGQPDLTGIAMLTPQDPKGDQVIQMAIQTIDERLTLGSAAQDLASAGLVAITWLNKYSAINSWSELLQAILDHPQQNWMTQIACLYGITDLPGGLLAALVQPGAPSKWHTLAVHAILSNPLTDHEQLAILADLCHDERSNPLPVTDRLSLLHSLSEQHPRLARKFSQKWIEIHPQVASQATFHKGAADHVYQLLEKFFQVEIRHNAGESGELSRLLDDEFCDAQNLFTEFASHYLDRKHNLRGEKGYPSGIANIYDRAIKPSELAWEEDSHAASQAGLALVLADQGQLDEATRLVPLEKDPLSDDVESLFAIAKLSQLAGDEERAWQAATRLLFILEQKASSQMLTVWGSGFSLFNFGKLLLDIHKAHEASQVLDRAVHICPNEADLLGMLAHSYQLAHLDQKTADTLNTLVSLNPEVLDYRREYARSLELLGEWESSLEQRGLILEAGGDHSHPENLPDEYAYAHCAIKAGKPDLALDLCEAILDQDQHDSQAQIYCGEACMMKGETDRGIEFLTHATQIAPNRPETWLALAGAQRKLEPLKVVIETLKNASQAVPDSALIHYALGDLYLLDNEPTLALPDLQSAVELSPIEPQFLVSYASALKLLGHIEASREMFGKAYRIEPEFPSLALAYAETLMELGKLEEAIAPYETLLNSRTPHELSLCLDYARCVLALNKQGSAANPPLKALVALNEILQMDPGHAEAKALTAEALTANGEFELAFQAYREALDTPLIEDQQWFERLSFGFGCVAASLGKQDIAIAALQDAGQVNPDNPAIFIALSDAYIAANLAEDALRSARTVLEIDGANPDRLAWFASQLAKLSGYKFSETFNSSPAVSNEVISEALSALEKAIQLAPTRTEFLVQLGNFQSSIGEHEAAQATFAAMATLDFATVEDLISAAKYLSEMGDHLSAISCLEKGISIDSAKDHEHNSVLYINLAREYLNNHDPSSAIQTLDTAIEIIPGESSLISLKVDILLGQGQTQDALNVIETALQKIPDGRQNTDLVFLASQIHRCKGNFPASIEYARTGAAVMNEKGSRHAAQHLSIRQRTQIAEIYRSLLQPDYALQILQDDVHVERSAVSVEQDYLDYIFLYTELALNTGERIRPDIQDVKLEPSHPEFSRLMAINSRLMNKAGNSKQAEQIFLLAFNKLVDRELPASEAAWSAPLTSRLSMIAVLEAAQDLGLWDQALSCAQQLAETAPDEPHSYLQLVRTLVLRAEFRQLCQLFEVVQHKPSTDSQPLETHELCKQYLDQARETLGTYLPNPIVSEYENNEDQIHRWHTRADIIFSQTVGREEEPSEFITHQVTPGEAAALISHFRQNISNDTEGDALTHMIKLARIYPRNPLVILQVALALREGNPQEAMKSLQSVLEHNPCAKNPYLAFCNILLAHTSMSLEEFGIAQEAIENAISFWPDEPAWHMLAAEAYQQTNAITPLIQHLEEAARLAPDNLVYLVELGKVLAEHANDDSKMYSQALTSFQKALDLEPNNVNVLIHLARTCYSLNRNDKAEDHARAALALAPDRAELYQLLSEIAIAKSDYQGAYEYAGQAIQANPADTRSTVMLARALTAMGRHQEALSKLNTVIPLVKDACSLHLERVNILRKVSGPQIALNELKSLTTSFPDDFEILNALSKSFYEVGELENAVAVAKQALKALSTKSSPNEQANLHLLIGQALRQAGQLDPSIRHLGEAIQLAPNRLEPYLELGLARKERREYQQALQIFERATLIAPNDPRAPFQAGLALKESKDYKSSEMMLRRAVSLAPNDLSIRRQLAAVVALNLIHNPRSTRIAV